jgi:hypothetical protein
MFRFGGRFGATIVGLSAVAAMPALADPPVLTEAPPLVLDYAVDGSQPPILASSERGLDEDVPDLSAFAPLTTLPLWDTAEATAVYGGCVSIVDSNNDVIVPASGSCTGGGVNFGLPISTLGGGVVGSADANVQVFLISTGYRLFDTTAVSTTLVGGGIQAFVRVAGHADVLSSATALSLGDAQSQAMAGADFSFTRGRLLPALIDATGVIETETIDSVTTRLTGRDQFLYFVVVVGANPVGSRHAIVGPRGACANVASDCAGGVKFDHPGNSDGSVTVGNIAIAHTDFYTTTTINRTITSTGTAFIDVPIAHEGVAHAASQTVGLALGDRFLRRLTTPGAAGFGQPLGPSDEASRWRVFLEGTGAVGDLSNDRYHFSALRGGLSRVINSNLDLGLAFEAGNWRYKHPDAFVPERAEGDLWRLGAFARYTPGPWRLHGAVIGGEQDVETTGISLAGAGTSRSKARARIYGAGAEVGYAIPVDGFTLTPHARVTALRWTSPATSETGGAAPLSIAKATREQGRLALGATLGKRYEIEPGLDLGVEIGARAFTTTGDTRGRVLASDAIASSSFVIDGPSGERSGVELSAGVTLVKDGRMAIAASYEGRFAGDEQSHAGMLTLKMTF